MRALPELRRWLQRPFSVEQTSDELFDDQLSRTYALDGSTAAAAGEFGAEEESDLFVGGMPSAWEWPEKTELSVVGGGSVTPEYLTVLFGLTMMIARRSGTVLVEAMLHGPAHQSYVVAFRWTVLLLAALTPRPGAAVGARGRGREGLSRPLRGYREIRRRRRLSRDCTESPIGHHRFCVAGI